MAPGLHKLLLDIPPQLQAGERISLAYIPETQEASVIGMCQVGNRLQVTMVVRDKG